MKRFSRLVFPLLFLSSLLTGYLGSSQVLLSGEHAVAVKDQGGSGPVIAVPTLPNGQRNILVITVDQMEESLPILEGIWIIGYLPQNSHLAVLPVYPSHPESAAMDKEVVDTFRMVIDHGQTAPHESFLNNLRNRNLWWSGYMVLDKVAWGQIVKEAKPGIDQEDQALLSRLTPTQDDPAASFYGQAALFQEMCWSISRQDADLPFESLLPLIPQHASSNLSFERLMDDLRILRRSSGNLVCDFPTFYADLEPGK